jgi:hypothetical protein
VQIKATETAMARSRKTSCSTMPCAIVLETKRGSVSLLQRRLTIGYSRASRLIEQMAASGIVGELQGIAGPRGQRRGGWHDGLESVSDPV